MAKDVKVEIRGFDGSMTDAYDMASALTDFAGCRYTDTSKWFDGFRIPSASFTLVDVKGATNEEIRGFIYGRMGGSGMAKPLSVSAETSRIYKR